MTAQVIDGKAALALLARSVHLGHDSLALIALGAAVRCGEVIPAPLWRYCEQVAHALSATELNRLMQPLTHAAAGATGG